MLLAAAAAAVRQTHVPGIAASKSPGTVSDLVGQPPNLPLLGRQAALQTPPLLVRRLHVQPQPVHLCRAGRGRAGAGSKFSSDRSTAGSRSEGGKQPNAGKRCGARAAPYRSMAGRSACMQSCPVPSQRTLLQLLPKLAVLLVLQQNKQAGQGQQDQIVAQTTYVRCTFAQSAM